MKLMVRVGACVFLGLWLACSSDSSPEPPADEPGDTGIWAPDTPLAADFFSAPDTSPVADPGSPLRADTSVDPDAPASPDMPAATDPRAWDSGGPTPPNGESIEIAGQWQTYWDEHYLITDESWGTSSIHAFSNAENWAITQWPPDDRLRPNLFTKEVWLEIDANGYFWQCTVLWDAVSFEEAAQSDASADPTDPATRGCGFGEWTLFGPEGGFNL